jgi:hypothetical protein
MKQVDKSKIYGDPEDFFRLKGNVIMTLTPSAAQKVCLLAAERGLTIIGVDGGIIRDDGKIQSRIDCSWCTQNPPPLSKEAAHRNNMRAYDDIEMEKKVHDAFLLTVRKIDGTKM